MMEVWKPVVGYEWGYEVSSHGNVRSIARDKVWSDGSIHRLRGIQLKPSFHKFGYLQVWLRSETGESKKSLTVHSLVAAAFLGARPDGMLVLHGDGVPTNNRPGNLRYGTYAENSSDSARHGTMAAGENHGNAKLCDDDVREIRQLLSVKTNQREIARRFSISPASVANINSGLTWSHLDA